MNFKIGDIVKLVQLSEPIERSNVESYFQAFYQYRRKKLVGTCGVITHIRPSGWLTIEITKRGNKYDCPVHSTEVEKYQQETPQVEQKENSLTKWLEKR